MICKLECRECFYESLNNLFSRYIQQNKTQLTCFTWQCATVNFPVPYLGTIFYDEVKTYGNIKTELYVTQFKNYCALFYTNSHNNTVLF